jgi:hypothetical protein
MGDRLRLADLLSGLSIVADLGYGLPIETALRSYLIGTVLARRMDLPEREVADVFYVTLLFHVGCVAYAHETFELFGDDQAVRRAAVETDLTDMRDIFATLIPGATRGLPPAARVRGAVRMAVTGRAFGNAISASTGCGTATCARSVAASRSTTGALPFMRLRPRWCPGRRS